MAFNYATYDSSANASASQAMNKKAEMLKDSDNNRSMDVVIENFDVAFGNKLKLLENLFLNNSI